MIAKTTSLVAGPLQGMGSPMLPVALSTLTVMMAMTSIEVHAAPARSAEEVVVAACIERSAAGRDWLKKTLWGLRDQEGGWVGAEIPNRDGSHDLGPLQVNSWWVLRLADITAQPVPKIRHWLKHDACFNVEVARWIFLSGLSTTQNYWEAIGIYHSPTGWRQRRYSQSVAQHLRQRFGSAVFSSLRIR